MHTIMYKIKGVHSDVRSFFLLIYAQPIVWIAKSFP